MAKKKAKRSKYPLVHKGVSWEKYDIEKHGISQGLLTKFDHCRQDAKWWTQGLTRMGDPSLALSFGIITHAALELAYRDIQIGKLKKSPTQKRINKYLDSIEQTWKQENPRATADLNTILSTALGFAGSVLPTYFDLYPEDFSVEWVSIEQEIDIPYKLPDGRRTRLVGKMDGVYRDGGIWLLETKTKSRIDEAFIADWLPMDLQTNWYMYAIRKTLKKRPRGVLYNIIRRPQLRLKQKETSTQFAVRCAQDVIERPEWYFYRFKCKVGVGDLLRFQGELEERVTAFYDWWQGRGAHYRNSNGCETKYGICEWFGACTGRLEDYKMRDKLFPELELEVVKTT